LTYYAALSRTAGTLPMTLPFDALTFTRGPAMKNRFMLAPLTNTQSHADGTLSDDEFRWLTMRAQGGFGLVMTCAAHVQAQGQGFPGQLGVFSDAHLEGLTRLATALRAAGSLSAVQLHHAGMRSPAALIGTTPLCPSERGTGARAMTTAEVEQAIEDFVLAAERAERAGFDGVELHGAHGYLLCQFLSSEINHRDDRFGGSLENRARPLFDIIAGIRARCRPDFQLGVRLSPERFGMDLAEVRAPSRSGSWPRDRSTISTCRSGTWARSRRTRRSRAAASCRTSRSSSAAACGSASQGKSRARPTRWPAWRQASTSCSSAARRSCSTIFPLQAAAEPAFAPAGLPVTPAYLAAEGLGEAFITYMRRWPGFVCAGPFPNRE
jgi:2,4-dienoyl-CoA reductase-like NADH-dependent reductase (Old Yellow Enzyme family)